MLETDCNTTINMAKEAYDHRIRDKLINCPAGSKSFWSLAKSVGRNFKTTSFPPLTADDGATAVTAKEKADMFARLFAANSTLDSQGKAPPSVPNTNTSMPDITFCHRTIKRILSKLDCNKAVGPDGVPAIVLKKCAPELTSILVRLFTMSYKRGKFPSSWKLARVQHVPKKGKKTIPRNYRSIALLPIISKVMEKAVNVEILKHLETAGIINDSQYGYRHQRSTADLLAYVTYIWESAMEGFGESQAVALDISKAFDRVWHQALLNKLPCSGFSPSTLPVTDELSTRDISTACCGRSLF